MKPPSALLQRHHRRAVWLRPLWILAAGLAWCITLAQLEVAFGIRVKLLATAAGLALLARFWRRPTLRDTACEIDAKAGLNNRLETLIELGDRTDAFATATRSEVSSHLVTHRTPRPYLWIAGLGVLATLLAINVALLPRSLALAPPAHQVAVLPESAPKPRPLAPPPAGPPPPAVLRWISPDEAIAATGREEFPASAQAESITGLHDLSVTFALNGELRDPLLLAAEVAPGVKDVASALTVAPLDAKPYDVATYFLSAERVRPPNVAPLPVWPPVYSSLQFVEIRPPREEPMSDPAPDDPATAILKALRELKQNQRAVARDSFALGHGLPDKNDLGWSDLLGAGVARQDSVLKQTASALASVVAKNFPSDVSDRLKDATTAMNSAAAALARTDPGAATPPATRALAHLVAAEALAARFIWENRLRDAGAVAAKDQENAADLPDRAETPAGRLEKLAAQQAAIADQLAARSAPPGIFAEQDAVARAIVRLGAEQAFAENVNALIQSAAVAAGESATQLNERDPEAATEPATRAAQSLREALDALEAVARQRAAEQMLAVQRSFNRAATDLSGADPNALATTATEAEKRAELAESDLRREALREQRFGSADVARQLNELAQAIRESEVQRQLGDIANNNAADRNSRRDAASQTLRNLAQRAASGANQTNRNGQSLENTLAELRRAQANLNRIAGRDPADNGPLRWVRPSRTSTAKPNETVALLAEARSQTGYTGLQLRVRVNGEPRSPMDLPIAIAPGTHPVPISLSMDDFKVRLNDMVSYVLTATPTGGSATEIVSSRMQMIEIRASPRPPANPANRNPRQQQYVAAVRALIRAQRPVVDRAHTLETDGGKQPEAAALALLRQIEADQRAIRGDTSSVVQTYERSLPPEHLALLSEAQSEMQKAEQAWQRAAPAAATPPAIRALAALLKILDAEGEGDGDGSGGGPENGSGSAGGSGVGSGQASDYSTTMSNAINLAQSAEAIGATNAAGIPPPPGPNAEPRDVQAYASVLADRISGLIQLAEEALRQAKRKEVLTTANPADAPPSYRPAVADYFEKLARERPGPPPTAP
jgi:hypothetical protein